ncbi:MAG: VOC family protein [Halanaerobium sp.]|nr:VOC family protein [Halanaerobium sp.]
MDNRAKMVNLCPVFISDDVNKTVEFYVEKLGFRYARHYDKTDNFATLYRDAIEFIIVKANRGAVKSNSQRYGSGYDAYIDPATVAGVDILYEEFLAKGVQIVSEPKITEYGSYEFVIEDIDGRLIGIGRVKDQETFFADSDYLD